MNTKVVDGMNYKSFMQQYNHIWTRSTPRIVTVLTQIIKRDLLKPRKPLRERLDRRPPSTHYEYQ